MSDSDFWGKPVPKTEEMYCHHEENRCLSDPHFINVQKVPGEACINDYECKSGFCLGDGETEFKYCAGKGEN